MATNNKCSNCGGALVFDPQSGELKCTHCEAITDIEDTKVLNDKKIYDENSSIKHVYLDNIVSSGEKITPENFFVLDYFRNEVKGGYDTDTYLHINTES